jgi:hypothetical protein
MIEIWQSIEYIVDSVLIKSSEEHKIARQQSYLSIFIIIGAEISSSNVPNNQN